MVAVKDLSERSREIFKHVVETYLETGEPVGSRAISRQSPLSLSAASIRNVMSDLEALGLLFAPHTSAGRLPTEAGLRLFVDGMLQVGDLGEEERRAIEAQVSRSERTLEDILTEASEMLSGLSRCAGLVIAPKGGDARIKHMEFVPVDARRALVISVTEDGQVENRMIDVPQGMLPSTLTEASNYLSARLRGRTLSEARTLIQTEIDTQRRQLNELTRTVIEAGLATWSGDQKPPGDDALNKALIVSGRARLLEDVHALEDLERVRMLFDQLENKRNLMQLLGAVDQAEGVRIFIGAENKLFGMSGSSLVISPFTDQNRNIVGVIGVIGPTRLNYARIIPMVDYTAKLVGRLLG